MHGLSEVPFRKYRGEGRWHITAVRQFVVSKGLERTSICRFLYGILTKCSNLIMTISGRDFFSPLGNADIVYWRKSLISDSRSGKRFEASFLQTINFPSDSLWMPFAFGSALDRSFTVGQGMQRREHWAWNQPGLFLVDEWLTVISGDSESLCTSLLQSDRLEHLGWQRCAHVPVPTLLLGRESPDGSAKMRESG